MSVSREEVVWCYRLLLGREPESEMVIREHSSISDRRELVRVLLNSDEFVSRSLKDTHLSGFATSNEPGEDFHGCHVDDVQRLTSLVQSQGSASEGFYTDCFGQRFHPSYHENVADRIGLISNTIPIPSDRHLSDGIEYAAAALAFESASGRDRFSAAELGAGWGPWTTFFGIIALRLGFKNVLLAAFEADAGRYAQMRQHLENNGLVKVVDSALGTRSRLKWKFLNAAAWWRNETVFWPDNLNPADSGMRAETQLLPESGDYRGFKIGFKEIPALDISEALAEIAPLDILHIDIQGSESELVSNSINFLNDQVRSMLIGTHSRTIEGEMITLLSAQGWRLVREKPCKMDCNSVAPTLAGKTLIDGAQYWVNSRHETRATVA